MVLMWAQRVSGAISEALVRAYNFASWCWFLLNRHVLSAFWRWMAPGTAAAFRHKIVLIGDGLAAGYGDYITMAACPGVEARLTQRRRRNTTCTKHAWTVLNFGEVGSTSHQWRPDATPRPNLFDAALMNDATADADIVVVALGSMDSVAAEQRQGDDDPVRTVANLRSIAEVVAGFGKHVVLCTVPLPRDAFHASFPTNRARNELLRRWIDQLPPDSKIHLGAELDSLQMQQPVFYFRDGHHFSSQGYDLFTRLLLEKIDGLMTKLEWAVIKDKLVPPAS